MAKQFRIGILDAVPKIYWGEDGGITDGEKFYDLLSAHSNQVNIDIFYTTEGHYPDDITDYDGYLVSGSPASVNDQLYDQDRCSNPLKPLCCSLFLLAVVVIFPPKGSCRCFQRIKHTHS